LSWGEESKCTCGVRVFGPVVCLFLAELIRAIFSRGGDEEEVTDVMILIQLGNILKFFLAAFIISIFGDSKSM
jgi:hypothetical protein